MLIRCLVLVLPCRSRDWQDLLDCSFEKGLFEAKTPERMALTQTEVSDALCCWHDHSWSSIVSVIGAM